MLLPLVNSAGKMCCCESTAVKALTRAALLLSICLWFMTTPSTANVQQYHPMRHYPLQRVQHNKNVYTKTGAYALRQSDVQVQPKPRPQGLSPSDIEKYNEYQRQIQQWQIAVVVPPGGGPPPPGAVPVQGGQSPPPAAPGNVWIQVPAGSYYPEGSGYPPSGGGYPGGSYPPASGSYPPPPSGAYPPPPSEPSPNPPPPSESFPSPPSSGSIPEPPAFPPPDNSYPPPDSYPFPPSPPESPAPVPGPATGSFPEEQFPEPLPPPSNELPSSPSNELPPPSEGASTTESEFKKFCKAPRGQFPGSSCNKFINCWDDVAFEQDCPAGLYFNPAGFCDYPFNVDCKESGTSSEPGSGLPPSGSLPPSEGVYPPGEAPPPAGGVPSPPGSLPPPEGGFPPPGGAPPSGEVPSSGGPPPTSGGPPPPPGGDIGGSSEICPTSYGTFRSKTNCGQFYVCVGGKPYEFICPAGLNFHEDLKVCDYPYRVECNGVPTNPIPQEPEEPEAENQEGENPPPSPPVEQPSSPLPPPPPASGSPAPQLPPPSVPAGEQVNPGYYGLKNYNAYNNQYYGLKTNYNNYNPNFTLGRYHCQGRNNYVYRLSPTCSSVAVCQNGYPQVINCRAGQSYDSRTRRCLSVYQARC